MSAEVFASGQFRGVSVTDPFALAAMEQNAITVTLGKIPWPAGVAPSSVPLGNYKAGEKITGPLSVKADVLIVLYTDPETSALLEVFTGNNDWSATRRKEWCGYAHNFATFKPIIQGIGDDTALEQGMFGYLSAIQIGGKTVVLYKTELHPKQNGTGLPFVPVMRQLITELAPKLVISTGTAGAIGGYLNCGDVAVTTAARFHVQKQYPKEGDINVMSGDAAELKSTAKPGGANLTYAANDLTKLSLSGLAKCYTKLQTLSGYSFVRKNVNAPGIYVGGKNAVPGTEPMAIVSADYLTVDDNNDSEGLQALGIMNDTDDAFLFYAIRTMTGTKPQWVSVRNASEPQIVGKAFPAGTSSQTIVNSLKGIAGSIYGIYQYCTTVNSALACWGVAADF